MAIRYVAPTVEQPSEREMRERAARQRNIFGAGRNLSRAFVRQNAIDNALQQQAAERAAQQQTAQAQPAGPSLEGMQSQFKQFAASEAERQQAEENQRAAQAILALLPTADSMNAIPGPESIDYGALPTSAADNRLHQAGATVGRSDVLAGQRRGEAARAAEGLPDTRVEVFSGAPSEVWDELNRRADPEAGALRMAKVAAARSGSPGLFREGGYPAADDQGERFRPAAYGTSLSEALLRQMGDPSVRPLTDPYNSQLLLDEYHSVEPFGKEAGKLKSSAEYQAENEPGKLESLWLRASLADDQYDYLTRYLASEPAGTPEDAEFRRQASKILALRGFRDLGPEGLDIAGLLDDAALDESSRDQLEGLNRKRLLEQFLAGQAFSEGGEDFGLFDGPALSAGAEELPFYLSTGQPLLGAQSLKGRVTPEMLSEMLRRLARGEKK